MNENPHTTAKRHAIAQAYFLTLLEIVKAQRASQWVGASAGDLWGLLLTVVFYAVLLLALQSLLRGALMRVPGLGARQALAQSTGAFLAGCLVWGVLSVHREFYPTAEDALVLGGLLALAVLHAMPWRRLQSSAGAALLIAVVGALALGEILLFDPARSVRATLGAFGFLAVAFAVLACLTLWRSRRGAMVWFAVYLMLLLVPALYVAGGVGVQRPAGEARPNVVFIIADTLRAKDLRLYGGDIPAPNLERLAARGTLFERGYSLAPWTLPSMTAMFASQYPAGLTPGLDQGAWNQQLWQYRVPESIQPLQYRLRDAGYATGAVTGNALLWVTPGMTDGFETLASSHPILLVHGGLFRMAPLLQAVLARWVPALAPLRPHDTTAALSRYATAYVQRHAADPFYLWLHYIDPHAPYDPPSRYRTATGAWPFFHPYKGGDQWNIPILGTPDFAIPETEREYVTSLYKGEIQYVDELLGEVMATLEDRGLLEETYICFTADHGEELWEHGDWGHGQSLYDEQVHVPWIIAGPGIAAQRVAAPVSALDLMPTLAALAGVPGDPGWRGRSLDAVLKGAAAESAPVYLAGTSNRSVVEPLQAVVQGQYKLVRGVGSGTMRLYDLAADPGEQTDVAGAHPEVVASMAASLMAWAESFPSTFPALPGGEAAGQELLENLRGMGYL